MSLNDQRNCVQAVILDLCKAFIKGNHDRLQLKLDSWGMGTSMVWFDEVYRVRLSESSQRVILQGYQSCSLPVASGVAQGSVLGPKLFVFYVNDIVHTLSYANIKSHAVITVVYSFYWVKCN